NFSYCQCPECSKVIAEEGTPAGPIIRFVNQVAAHFPDKIISTLAYEYSRQAPKITKPASNVQIMLCTIELSRSKPIEEDPSSRSFLKDIEDWGKISNHIYLWDYTVNFSHHISPFPNQHTLQPNIQFFSKNGAHEHFQQSNTDIGHEFSELKSYLISRLLWNPNVNADSVKNEFLTGYYKAAAPFIRNYIDRLEGEIISSGEGLDIYGSPVGHASTFLSEKNTQYYTECFNNAENAVKDDLQLLQRVKTARLPLEYALMEIGKNDMFGPRGWYTESNGKFILRQDMRNMLEDFNTTCIKNGVKSVNEAGLTPADYYKATLRFIDVQVDDNLAFRKKVTASPMPNPRYSNGDPSVLTNGVQGASDYKVHWLGWENTDFELTLDLEKVCTPKEILIGSLYDPKSWILHPHKVTCQVSIDGKTYRDAGTVEIEGNQQKEDVTHSFRFDQNLGKVRFVKFKVEGTHTLPSWHPSEGGLSWVFLDEIVVR
ncbi:MAG: DUF4838 domain-containing protein, partial [Bacteroidota bacterium]|nr:DUF4838 domain-containing protein [Bacteroidota bacterium]